MLNTATSRNPVEAFPSISMFNGPELVMCKMMYPMLGPQKSRQVLTYAPGVTKVNGPAVPEVQIDVLVLHWLYAVKEHNTANSTPAKVRLMLLITVKSEVSNNVSDHFRCRCVVHCCHNVFRSCIQLNGKQKRISSSQTVLHYRLFVGRNR